MAIILTAPIGAILMPVTAPYLLHQDLSASEVMVARTRQNAGTKQKNSNSNRNPEKPDYQSSVNNLSTVDHKVVRSNTNLATIPQDKNNRNDNKNAADDDCS